ncbi:hypothetical protein DV515_00012313, partial [Chloebia gouldiae]
MDVLLFLLPSLSWDSLSGSSLTCHCLETQARREEFLQIGETEAAADLPQLWDHQEQLKNLGREQRGSAWKRETQKTPVQITTFPAWESCFHAGQAAGQGHREEKQQEHPGVSGGRRALTSSVPWLRSQALGMVSRKVVASLLLVSLLSVLAEQTQGFMPFFTQSDFQKMQLQEKERNKAGQKKSLSSLQQLQEEGFSEQSTVDVNAAKILQQALPVRAWLTPRQLEKYQDVLEKLLAELLQDTPDGSEEKALELLKLKDSTY